MKAFTFVRPASIEEASKAAAVKGSVIKAGGIDLLDRMKERVDEPDRVVWLGEIGGDAKAIVVTQGSKGAGSLIIGASVPLADIASSEYARGRYPALADAAGAAASPQLRERATIAGNLCQHTRCGYYRHRSFPCFKRGDGACPVLEDGAVQDTAAIFGNRPCASAHPSSLAPVLCAFGASINVITPDEKQSGVLIADAFAAPRRGVAGDVALPEGGVIVSVYVPRHERSAYEEVRQKAAFDWALVSCCVVLDMDADKVRHASVWLGSVAPTPWHAEAAEKALIGKLLTDETIRTSCELSVAGASPLPGNSYKVDLVKVVVRRALLRLRSGK